MLVLPDVDVAAAASAGAWGSFLHQGQICMTTGRHLVHADVYDEYVQLLAEKAKALPAGDPASGAPLGPIIDDRQCAAVHDLVTRTVDQGAQLLAGGTHEERFYAATVLGGVSAQPAFTDEIFGPVAPVLRYESVDEAVDLINASDYGLSVAILSGDAYRAFELGDRIDSGILHIKRPDGQPTSPSRRSAERGRAARARASAGTRRTSRPSLEQQWVTVQSSVQTYPF